MSKTRGRRNGGVKASAWEQPITDEAEINSPFVATYRLGRATAYLTTRPKPVEPPDFRKAAATKPALREELRRLTQTYEHDDLAALANVSGDMQNPSGGDIRNPATPG
jgi:hypothetical protein